MAHREAYIWKSLFPSRPQCRPCYRSKQAACCYQGYVYMYGGRDGQRTLRDFWRYHIATNVWARLECGGDTPPPLQEHTMVAERGCLYIFGGELGFGSCGETPLWIYNLDTQTWVKPILESEVKVPIGRRGHTAVAWNGGMHVYGGYVDLKGSSGDLWTLDFESQWWHLVVAAQGENSPVPRHGHTAVAHNGSMWVYGGLSNLQPLRDLWRWNFGCRQWTRLKNRNGPGFLHGHSAVRVANTMMIFGGEDGEGTYRDELWKLSFRGPIWQSVTPNHKISPTARTRHVLLASSSSHTYVRTPTAADPTRPHSAPLQPPREDSVQTTRTMIAEMFHLRPHSSPPVIGATAATGQLERPEHHFSNRVHPSSITASPDADSCVVTMATDEGGRNGRWAVSMTPGGGDDPEVNDTSYLLGNEQPLVDCCRHLQDGPEPHPLRRFADEDLLPHPGQTDHGGGSLPCSSPGDRSRHPHDFEWILEDFPSEPSSPVSDFLLNSVEVGTPNGGPSVSQYVNNREMQHPSCLQSLPATEKDSTGGQLHLPVKNSSVVTRSIDVRPASADMSHDRGAPPLGQRTRGQKLQSSDERISSNAFVNGGYESSHEDIRKQIHQLASQIHQSGCSEQPRSQGNDRLDGVDHTDGTSVQCDVRPQTMIGNGAAAYADRGKSSFDRTDKRSQLTNGKLTDRRILEVVANRRQCNHGDQSKVRHSQVAAYEQSTVVGKSDLHRRSKTVDSLPVEKRPLLSTDEEATTRPKDRDESHLEETTDVWPSWLYVMGGEESGSCTLHQNGSPLSVWKCCIVKGKLTDDEIKDILAQN